MYRRIILESILEALADTPVLFLRGARQSGKSTLVQMIADGPHRARYITLDNAAAFSAAGSDPAGFIAGLDKPVVIDEAQRVPELLLSIKEDVDRHRNPGRYILTGSADILTVPKVADALAGRMELMTLWPLCVAEIDGHGGNPVDALYCEAFINGLRPGAGFRLYERMVAGGFPEPLQRKTHRRRQAWFDAYISTLLDRDIRNLSNIKDLTAMPRLLKLLAARIGTLHNQSEVSRSSGLPNSTLTRYMSLLKSTFLIQELPAWSTNLGKRLVKSPKLFMVDTGLAGALLGLDAKGLEQEGEVAGRVFENFVTLELFKHVDWAESFVRLYHFRSRSGQEVDIVLEDSRGRIVGLEVKRSASPSPQDFAGLKTLQELLGERFVRGVLVYTGREVVPFGERLHAVPVDSLLA